jgi:radical SAM superfamily enzyme YgiQ (UPF0313 family)
MAEVGCCCVAFGFESADASVLARYGKPGPDAARRAVERCRRAGLRVAGYWILGLPGETFESSVETIRFASELGLDYASFSSPSPDFGTDLRELALASGRLEAGQSSSDRSRPLAVATALGEGEMRRLHALALRSFYLRPSYAARSLARLRGPRELRELAAGGWTVLRRWLGLRFGIS